jgi:hypothetical protein
MTFGEWLEKKKIRRQYLIDMGSDEEAIGKFLGAWRAANPKRAYIPLMYWREYNASSDCLPTNAPKGSYQIFKDGHWRLAFYRHEEPKVGPMPEKAVHARQPQ